MRRTLSTLALPLLVVLAVIAMSAIYIVDVRERALVLRFGEVVAVRESPGLGLKIPLLDRVMKYDARILGLPTDPMEVTPLDDRRLVVDAFARWQITDVVRFRRAVGGGGIQFAQQRLEGIMTNAIREVLGSVPSTTVLSADRTSLMNRIRDAARLQAENLGVQVIDVRLTRTDLPEQNLNATYARMRAEREREAADEIARGGEAAQRVRATADRTVVELTSEARRKAEVVRGEADATRNAVYADAFGRDPEFFAFTRSMTAYERALRGDTSTIVMDPKGEFFTYLQSDGMTDAGLPTGGSAATTSAPAPADGTQQPPLPTEGATDATDAPAPGADAAEEAPTDEAAAEEAPGQVDAGADPAPVAATGGTTTTTVPIGGDAPAPTQ